MRETERSTNKRVWEVGKSYEITRATQRSEHKTGGLQGQRKD